MIRQVYEVGRMQVHWNSKSQEKEPIGTITIHDAGIYRVFLSDSFYLCYKILKTESVHESQKTESVLKMPEDWVPFYFYSTEEYPLYSLSPTLEFGSWSLQTSQASDSQLSPSLPQQEQHQRRNQVSRQPSPVHPQPSAKQVQPSSPSHQKSHPHHSERQQPSLKNRYRNAREQKDGPSSNSTFHGQHQSRHQWQKEQRNVQPVPNDHISLQSQWIPLERLTPSPSSQPSPKQRVKQPRRGHASAHHSIESTHSHEQTTSHQQKSKRQHRHHVPAKPKEHLSQQPRD